MNNLNNVVNGMTPQEKQVWAEHRAENTKWEQENLKVELTSMQKHILWLKQEIVKTGKRNMKSLSGLNLQQLERIFDHC